jgi:flagellum-specific ATP synthase
MQALINPIRAIERRGELLEFMGLQIIANGPPHTFVGEICEILDHQHQCVMQAEVLGFANGKVTLIPLSQEPLRLGYTLVATGQGRTLKLGTNLQGRILNAYANPIDDKGAPTCTDFVSLQEEKSTNPLLREPIQEKLNTQLSVIDGLLPLGKGQRIGIFAGSGVGKSSLLANLACKIPCDIQVIAMIGERGREVNEFIHHHLDETTLQKSIVVVACSDEPALIRRQAVYTAITIAEYFCKQNKDVLLLMDSITRFAMAQREIGLM